MQENKSNLCILPVIHLKCIDHPTSEVVNVCTKLECECQTPFICPDCAPHPSDHRIEEKDQFLLTFCREIERNAKIQQQIYDETIGKKENMSLLRWVEDCDNHINKLNDYIKAQKFQMEQDIEEFKTIINKTLNNILEKSFTKFDEFLENYHTSLETFQLFKEDVFQLNSKYKYVCNPNILASKLINQNAIKSSKLIQEIKRAILIAKETNSKSQDFRDHLHLSLKELNKLIDDLPSYKGAGSFQDELTDPFQKKIEEFYMENLQIHKNQPISLSLANYKDNRLNSSRAQKPDISLSMKFGPSSLINIDMQSIISKSILNFFDPNLGINEQEFQQNNLQFQQQKLDLKQRNQELQQELKQESNNKDIQHNKEEYQQNKIAQNKLKQLSTAHLYQELSSVNFHEINYPSYQPRRLNMREIGKISLSENDEGLNQKYTSMCYIGYNLIALAGREPHVYDIISKKIYTPDPYVINKHYSDLISITSISPMFQPLHLKDKIIFATSSQDSSIVFWTVDKNKVINSFQKLLGFLMPVNFILDLQDGARILAVDGCNEIQLLEYHNYRWLYSKKISQSKITDVKLCQNSQIVVSFEDGQISILQLNISYNSSSTFDEIQVFQTGVIGITSLGLIPKTWEKKNFYILGCKDGTLKLFDINQKKVMATFQSNQGMLLENIVVRENKKCAFSIVYCASNDKNLKAYHFAESSTDNVIIEEQNLLTLTDYPSSLQGQYKIQVLPSFEKNHNSPLVLLLSDTQKHLIVMQIEPSPPLKN